MKKNRLWMRAAAALFAATFFIAGAVLAQDKGQSKTFEGVVTDAACGKSHTMMGNVPDKQCVVACVMGGSKYGLVVGDKVYTIEGKTDGLDKFAAEKVKVTGTVSGDTISVESFAPAGK